MRKPPEGLSRDEGGKTRPSSGLKGDERRKLSPSDGKMGSKAGGRSETTEVHRKGC